KNILAGGSAGHPIETSAAMGHAFGDVLGGHGIGGLAIGLKSRGYVAGMLAEQLMRELAAHYPDRRWVHLEDVVLVMEHDSLAGAFEQRAKLSFAGTERGSPLGHAAFEGLGQIPEFALGFLAFADVPGDGDMDVFPFHPDDGC